MSDLNALQSELVDQIIGLLQLSLEQSDNHHLTFAIMVLVKDKMDLAVKGTAKAIDTPTIEGMEDAHRIINQYLEIIRL